MAEVTGSEILARALKNEGTKDFAHKKNTKAPEGTAAGDWHGSSYWRKVLASWQGLAQLLFPASDHL